jgi:diphthine-ammonia ligase
MRVAILFSGGKDSTYATWIVQHQGWDVASLVTVRPSSRDSLMFHSPTIKWTSLQAQAMGLQQIVTDTAGRDELQGLREKLSGLKTDDRVSGLVTGAVASDYQKTRFDNMCDTVGMKTYSPLWHKNPKLLVADLRKAGFRIILTAVAANGLDESWLGRELSDHEWSRLEKLSERHGIHLTGEGGEYESFVLDAPHFSQSIEIEKSGKEWEGDRGVLVVEGASLRNKTDNR